MPARPKTTDAEIVAAARQIVAAAGSENLSLQAVAEAVGIKAPSLYKRFADRAALIDAVRENALASLADHLRNARSAGKPEQALRKMADAYRDFAASEPNLYRILLQDTGDPSPAARAAIAPVFETLAALVGEHDALAAARTVTAFLHGFVTMEIGGNFRFGGSVDDAFEFGLSALQAGLASGRSGRAGKRRRRSDV